MPSPLLDKRLSQHPLPRFLMSVHSILLRQMLWFHLFTWLFDFCSFWVATLFLRLSIFYQLYARYDLLKPIPCSSSSYEYLQPLSVPTPWCTLPMSPCSYPACSSSFLLELFRSFISRSFVRRRVSELSHSTSKIHWLNNFLSREIGRLQFTILLCLSKALHPIPIFFMIFFFCELIFHLAVCFIYEHSPTLSSVSLPITICYLVNRLLNITLIFFVFIIRPTSRLSVQVLDGSL